MFLGCGHYPLTLAAESFDLHVDDVARAQRYRWLLAKADPRASTCGDYVARRQRQVATDVANQPCNAEYHRPRIAILIRVPVDAQRHRQVLRIEHLIACHRPWSEWSEGVAAL